MTIEVIPLTRMRVNDLAGVQVEDPSSMEETGFTLLRPSSPGFVNPDPVQVNLRASDPFQLWKGAVG